LRAELALDALEMAIWSRGGRIGGRWFTIRTVEGYSRHPVEVQPDNG
jgi:transposase InsO family protein